MDALTPSGYQETDNLGKLNTNGQNPTAEIFNLQRLLQSDFKIADYQRPYKWSGKNVNDLINDIITFHEKKAYRIGTIIIYKDNVSGQEEVVDGQQRYLTLSLIFKALKEKYETTLLDFNAPSLDNLKFDNAISMGNLKTNYNLIQSRVLEMYWDLYILNPE